MSHVTRQGLSWISKRVILTFVFYVSIILLGLLGVFYPNEFYSFPKYFFQTPSYLNDSSLNWTTSVWAGVLGIHGTISALSITFMGMFVSQVSGYADSGFESICKALLLRRSNFLFFSLNSIFSLLTGVILLAFGGGVIAYVISILISLFFILSYGLMYLRLYSVTENPNIIRGYLFSELEDLGGRYNFFSTNQQKLIKKFNLCCESLEFIESGWGSNFFTSEQRTLHVSLNPKKMILVGFCGECLREINEYIKNNTDGNKFKLRLNLSFHQNISNSNLTIEFKKGDFLDDSAVLQIEKMLQKTLLTSQTEPEEIVYYQKYEQAVIENLKNSLLKGNELGVDFGVKALLLLTDKNDVVRSLSGLYHSLSYANKKNKIDYAIFSAFFEGVSKAVISKKDLKTASEIMREMITLGRYVFTVEYFYEFYSMISKSLHDRVRYDLDDDFFMFDLYVLTARQNFMTQNYMAFEVNTKFLTKELRYLKHADDRESLSTIETRMLQCIIKIVTLILIRLNYLIDKNRVDRQEFKNLCNFLRDWSNAAFFEDVYYKEGTYDTLFIIPNEPDFDASRTLREVPDYEVSSVSTSSDTIRAIVFLMTQSPLNRNNLNTIFIRDKKDFLGCTEISTHDLQSLITFLKSDDFSVLLDSIEKGYAGKTNKLSIAEDIENLVVIKSTLITKEVIKSELNEDLIDKYKKEVTVSFEKHLNNLLRVSIIPVKNDVSTIASYLLINKREVMAPIDGVYYSMNGGGCLEKVFYI